MKKLFFEIVLIFCWHLNEYLTTNGWANRRTGRRLMRMLTCACECMNEWVSEIHDKSKILSVFMYISKNTLNRSPYRLNSLKCYIFLLSVDWVGVFGFHWERFLSVLDSISSSEQASERWKKRPNEQVS